MTVRLIHEVWRKGGSDATPLIVRMYFGPTEEAAYARYLQFDLDLTVDRGQPGVQIDGRFVPIVIRWAFYGPNEAPPLHPPDRAPVVAVVATPAPTPPAAEPPPRTPFVPRVLRGGLTAPPPLPVRSLDPSPSPEGGKDFCPVEAARAGT